MTGISRPQLSLLLITYVIFSSAINIVDALDHGTWSAQHLGSRSSLLCISRWLASPKVNQKILLGPNDINVHPGDTVQLPCIVARQSDAIVTWCWNDFCTLGKTHLLRHETTREGLISVYQYTAYPRFQLFINERLSTYWPSRVDRRGSCPIALNWNSFRKFHFANYFSSSFPVSLLKCD